MWAKTQVSATTWVNLDHVTKIDISETSPGDWDVRAHHQSPSATVTILLLKRLTTEADAIATADKFLSAAGVLEP